MDPHDQGIARELDQRIVEIQSLFEMSQVLNSSLHLRTTLNNLLLTPMGRMMISRGLVMVAHDSSTYTIDVLKGLDREYIGKKYYLEVKLDKPALLADIEETDCQMKNTLMAWGIVLVLPIISTNRTVGLIGLGQKIGNVPFTLSEIEFLSSLSNIAATAIENALMYHKLESVNRQLDKKVQELNTIFEIGKELNSTLDSERITNLLIYAIMGEMVVNRCFVYLKEDDNLSMIAYKGVQPQSSELPQLQGKGLLKSLAKLKEPFLIDENNLSRNLQVLRRLNLKIVVPMRVQDQTRGIILLGDKINRQEFRGDELDFLSTLSNQGMIALENARLFEETLEKQRMEEELNIAREIQERLLPSEYPKIDGIEIRGINIPSRQVGGDYFDCFVIDDDHLALTIADVSGKGVPASLLMSNLHAGLHSLASAKADMTAVVAQLNDLIHAHTSFDKFITFFYAELDINNKTLTYVNAGHNPPYIVHADRTLMTLETGGLILGMMPNMPYEKETVKLQTGDILLMFTDGVTEAKDPADCEYAENRLEKLLQQSVDKGIEAILENTIASITEFSAGAPQADDITLLGLKITN